MLRYYKASRPPPPGSGLGLLCLSPHTPLKKLSKEGLPRSRSSIVPTPSSTISISVSPLNPDSISSIMSVFNWKAKYLTTNKDHWTHLAYSLGFDLSSKRVTVLFAWKQELT